MGTRHSVVAGLLGAVAAVSLLSACATGTGSPESPGGSVSSSSTPSERPTGRSLPPPFPVTPLPTTPQKSPQPGEMTITGVVEAGVEGGCLLIPYGDKKYLLMGGDPNVVKAGARITVRGRPNPSLLSYCQQGTPFEVAEAHAAS
jgi:hypothetical protein